MITDQMKLPNGMVMRFAYNEEVQPFQSLSAVWEVSIGNTQISTWGMPGPGPVKPQAEAITPVDNTTFIVQDEQHLIGALTLNHAQGIAYLTRLAVSGPHTEENVAAVLQAVQLLSSVNQEAVQIFVATDDVAAKRTYLRLGFMPQVDERRSAQVHRIDDGLYESWIWYPARH